MTLKLFNATVMKAFACQNTYKGRANKAADRGETNVIYETPVGSGIQI